MGKKKNVKGKRSLGSLPKGLVHRKGATPSDPGNPFEITARMKRPKHEVHNRPESKPKNTKHALESLQRRQMQLRSSLKSSKKANVLVDRRIGQYDPTMSKDDRMLARLVKERTRQSQRSSKYRLDDDGNDLLTHKGEKLDPNMAEAIYSDDEDDNGNLEAVDTELHFGGSRMGQSNEPYGAYGVSSAADLSKVYGQRKTELDDLIARRKVLKAEKMQVKEAQVDTVEKLDKEFAEVSQMLQYRKFEKPSTKRSEPTKEDKEMNEWHMEMKQMMLKPKRRATDRTKTPEEIAKEEAEKLRELETRRLARMNGDFEEDELSDISLDGHRKSRKLKRKSKNSARNPDELSDSDDDNNDNDEPEARFTADGLKYFDKEGKVVEKPDSGESGIEIEDEDDDDQHPLAKGARVRGNYRTAEQYGSQEAWYDGEITEVHILPDGGVRYDLEYFDGDFEEDMLPENVKPVSKTQDEKTKEDEDTAKAKELHLKRSMARDNARTEIPYVFEVPTTLEALHDTIARYARTGKDASTIIQRIHASNSVRLDHRNTERMQNFYDVLLRRFVAVGDAMYASGDGGEELSRYNQLSSLTRTLYALAQDSPESAGAIWSRRIGILQNAHAKRLRDFELVFEENNEETPWPSIGTLLLLKALSTIFPVTDKRHHVGTPANLLLGQFVSQTPISSLHDVISGIFCAGLLLENGLEAKRVSPEATGFLAGVIRLFSFNPGYFALPTLEVAYNHPDIQLMRQKLDHCDIEDEASLLLRLEQDFLNEGNPNSAASILATCLGVVENFTNTIVGSMPLGSESELLGELSDSILTLQPKTLPKCLRHKLATMASTLAAACPGKRSPLRRYSSIDDSVGGIKTFAPRMQDPERYTMSRDKGKKSVQAAIDRTRREYKREHKAISRELRIDAAFIETERRTESNKKDSKAKAKRQKNFAWLEGEQATMNQQVAQGGGLLKGGGTGAARSKAASAQLGIKKGGKF